MPRKPDWLKANLGASGHYPETVHAIAAHGLHTICASGRCPNREECWSRGTATLMIGGDICTRHCRFCATRTGRPLPLDPEEPDRVAESIAQMGLRHAVITSVDRDDLPDLGAQHWAETIRSIRKRCPQTTIEVLVPDFQGRPELVDLVIGARPDVLSHNMETVRRLTPQVRSLARYDRSLAVLRQMARSGIRTKTGIMVGLGETPDEVAQTMDDVLATGCQVFTIGQYLQPTRRHIPVAEYITPQQFATYRSLGLQKGFRQVISGPLVRSSYHADEQLP